MSRKSYEPGPSSMFVPFGRCVYLSHLTNQAVAIQQITRPSTQHIFTLSAHSSSSCKSQNHSQLTSAGLTAQTTQTRSDLSHLTFLLSAYDQYESAFSAAARTRIDTDRTALHPQRDRDTLSSKMSTMVSRHFCCTDSRAKTSTSTLPRFVSKI